MIKNLKIVIITFLTIAVILSISGCSGTNNSSKNITPEQAVIKFWKYLDDGDYIKAYKLAYNDQNLTEEEWVYTHEIRWGEKGDNLKIYTFDVIGNTTLDRNIFEDIKGNFTEMKSIMVAANVSYMGQNFSGVSQYVVVKSDDGWKVLGYY